MTDTFIVSARKYRPSTFADVVGQEALTDTLKQAVRQKKLAGAYLFCGPRGVGKTTCARIFAKAINCLNPEAGGEACNQCESCRSFNENRSMNIQELNAAANNSVDDIREIIDQVRIPPQLGSYKVIILDEVHMLSAAASNALLKTLEEPPSYVVFILATTEKHKILPTILSRCQIFDFARMEIPTIVSELKMVAEKEGIAFEERALGVIAEKADGGMRDALSIFDQVSNYSGGNITYDSVLSCLNVLDYDFYFRAVAHLIAGETTQALLLLNEVINRGFDAGIFIGGLAAHLRNVLMSKDPLTIDLLDVSSNIRERYAKQAADCSLQFIYTAMRMCDTCSNAYRNSYNKRLSVELTLIDCSRLNRQAAAAPAQQPQSQPVAQQPSRPAQPVQQVAQPAAPSAPVPPAQPASSAMPKTPAAAPRISAIRTPSISIRRKAETTPAAQPEKSDSQPTETAPDADPHPADESAKATPAYELTQKALDYFVGRFILEIEQKDTVLAACLSSLSFKISAPQTITITAMSQSLFDRVKNELTALQEFLKENTICPDLSVVLEVNSRDHVAPNNPKAIFKDMLDRSPLFAQMVKEMELDIAR